MDFTHQNFYNKYFKKVLVIARFQGMHRGHKIVMEEAKRLSPNVTIGLRVDEGDLLNLDDNIKLLVDMGYSVIKTPDLDEPNSKWESFVEDYDIVVQGNPDVICKFQKSIDDKSIELKYIPRIGHISATKIREAIKSGDEAFAKNYVSNDVFKFLKEQL
jgi:predicted nucleotidyltransferase